MDKKEMENFVSGLENKLGKESSGIIADDLGILITDNNAMNDKLMQTNNELIAEREKTNKLTQANSSLLRQVGNYLSEGESDSSNTNQEPETFKDVSFSEFFDSKGRFVR